MSEIKNLNERSTAWDDAQENFKKVSDPTNEMGAGGVAGMQLPMGSPDDEHLNKIRELIRNKVREVVRKKAGGGGYTLYAPNPGKKGGSKPVGNFPTKMGAKRAELARFPPRDPAKLKRLRKEVDKMSKDPKKAAEKERTARKQKGTDKGKKAPKAPRAEGILREAGGPTPFTSSTSAATKPTTPTTPTVPTSPEKKNKISQDLPSFMQGFKAFPKGKEGERQAYVQNHLSDPGFTGKVKSSPNGAQALKALYNIVDPKKPTGAFASGQKTKTTAQGTTPGFGESFDRRMDFMNRSVISTIIKKSLTESLFREEKTESEWDSYISKLSKQALAGDTKFQSLQKNISKKTEGILDSALNSIKKAVDRSIKIKSFGVKHDSQTGQTYLAFSASFDNVAVEPLYIHIEGGVPKIVVSGNAKASLTKVDPDDAKLFRAELVTVQERVLDDMDVLSKAIQNRDKYLSKLESEVDGYVAGLAPLQISLLKQLLVKKYRKIT